MEASTKFVIINKYEVQYAFLSGTKTNDLE